jgi:hypothetical protein
VGRIPQAKICSSEELTTDWLNEEDREMQDANIIELYRRTRVLDFPKVEGSRSRGNGEKDGSHGKEKSDAKIPKRQL